MKPRILLFDIESSPILGYIWGMYEQNVIEIEEDWFMLSFSAKWLNGKQITKGLCDYTFYKKDKHNDRELVKELWKLFDEADILIGHNINAFDIKKCYDRFSFHGLKPPSPFKTIDTLSLARKHFKYSSNKLDYISDHLHLGRKVHHEGFALWKKCMGGDPKAWKKMKKYNRQDVLLNQKLYKEFLPFIENHPTTKLRGKLHNSCENCERFTLQSRGIYWVKGKKYQRLFCSTCGKWQKGKLIK